MSKFSAWLGNNWLIAIVGGALAAIIGTYAYAYISHAVSSNTPAVQSPGPGPVLIQVYPDRVAATKGGATIQVYVSGLTPDGAVEGDLNEPDGGTYYGESAEADAQGDWTFSPRWSPSFTGGGSTPLGDYRITILDKSSGATATAILHVVH